MKETKTKAAKITAEDIIEEYGFLLIGNEVITAENLAVRVIHYSMSSRALECAKALRTMNVRFRRIEGGVIKC